MITEYIADAIRNIRNNRLRTALTMLGIIIGIASVIAVITIGDGLTRYVDQEVNGFSSNMTAMEINSSETTEMIMPADLALLESSIPGLIGVTYEAETTGVVRGRRMSADVDITAGGPVLEKYAANKVISGHYFTQTDVDNRSRVCVIMLRDAERLCGTPDAVGKTLDITVGGNTMEFTVVGIRDNYSEAVLTMLDTMTDYLAIMEMPYTSYADLTKTDLEKGQSFILMFFKSDANVKEGTRLAERLIRNRHGLTGKKAVSTISMADVSEQIGSIMGAITLFMSFVAAISLLVGGIGVMNIMLVSVMERTREIGIRKSIGAQTGAILIQFLAESAIISLLGGVVGIILGITIAAIVCHAFDFVLIVKPTVVLGATVFSSVIGIFFGLHPARKAAKMRPIEALHY